MRSLVGVSLGAAIMGSGVYLTQPAVDAPYTAKIDEGFERKLSTAISKGKQGDWAASHALLSKYAKLDNPLAKLEYALLFSKGWGVDRNLEQARLLLLQAVQYDFAQRGRAAFELGRVYRLSKGEDCARIAFEWFSKAAQWGFSKAHVELGKSYAHGLGVDPDHAKALQQYVLAIESGSISAIVPVFEVASKQHRDGNADPARGQLLVAKYLPVLESSAKQGKGVAARALGRIFERGLLVKANPEKAMKWFALAASKGDAIAMHDLAVLGLSNTTEPLEVDKALTFLKQSSELGYPAAFTALGRIYLSEKSIKDIDLALAFWRKGALAGHAGSMAELAKIYFEGKLVPRNISRAKKFANQGAYQKHLGCKRILLEIAEYERQAHLKREQQHVVEG